MNLTFWPASPGLIQRIPSTNCVILCYELNGVPNWLSSGFHPEMVEKLLF